MLEQMRREAREMKAMEGALKWNMMREEDKQRKNDQREDAIGIMHWRQERKKGLDEYAADRAYADKITALKDSRNFQEFKRDTRSTAKEDEIQAMKDEYIESKEDSEWQMDYKRMVPQEDRKLIVDQHLERYALMSMYSLEEKERQRTEQKMDRDEAEEMQLGYEYLQARRERDDALRALEYARTKKDMNAPAQIDIPSRPFVPDNQPL